MQKFSYLANGKNNNHCTWLLHQNYEITFLYREILIMRKWCSSPIYSKPLQCKKIWLKIKTFLYASAFWFAVCLCIDIKSVGTTRIPPENTIALMKLWHWVHMNCSDKWNHHRMYLIMVLIYFPYYSIQHTQPLAKMEVATAE